METLHSVHWSVWVLLCIGYSAGLLMLGLQYSKRKSKPSAPVFDSPESEREFNDAQSEMYKSYQMAPIARFSSADGFRDTEILEMISFLGAEGILASYRTTLLGGVDLYTLEVREFQAEEALEALARRADGSGGAPK